MFNAYLHGDAPRRSVTPQFHDLLVTHGSSGATLFKDLTMVHGMRSSAVLRLSGSRGSFTHGSV